MNIHLLIICVISYCLAMMALYAQPVNRSSGFDALGHFMVEADIPAGSRHVVLEVTDNLSPNATWRPMVAGAIDGRAVKVMFRVPPQPGGKLFARIKTGTSTTLPPVELSGDDLYFPTYADSITSEMKLGFLESASPKLREWKELPVDQWQANVMAWALQNPLIESVEVVPPAENVCVKFKDGTDAILLRAPRRYTGPSVESAATSLPKTKAFIPASYAPVTRSVPPPAEPTPHNLPDSNGAITAFSLESTFPNSAPTIGRWLSQRGYSVTTYGSTTIDQILTWSASKPIAALFWQSHGVPYRRQDGSIGISLVTYQPATKALSDGRYAAMIKNQELKLAADADEKPLYAITSEFVRNHLEFAPNSIVMVDACYGGGKELADGFTDAGAGSYGSWDWLSGPYSGTPFLQLFDRLLGMNEEPPISTPDERSFALPMIRWWMSAFQFDYDPSPKYPKQPHPNAKLTWYDHPDKPGYILLPTIMRVIHEDATIGEQYAKFLIEGDFGDDPGESLREVLWGGFKMHVVRWEPYYGITIRMPSSPPVGNIEVVMKKGFTSRSNRVPITEWNVPFTYEITSKGSLTAKMVMNVKFRADMRGSRGNPEMPLQYLPRHFFNMADCYGEVTASGTHSPSPGTTITWSGGSNLTSADHNVEQTYQPRRIRNNGTILFNQGKVEPFQLTADGDFTETEVRTNPDGTTTTIVRSQGIGFGGFYPQPEMPINSGTGVFRGNTMTWSGADTSAKLSWPSVTPQMMPTEVTPR